MGGSASTCRVDPRAKLQAATERNAREAEELRAAAAKAAQEEAEESAKAQADAAAKAQAEAAAAATEALFVVPCAPWRPRSQSPHRRKPVATCRD